MPRIYSKESLIEKLQEIRQMGWIKNEWPGNTGGIGNTLEDLLGGSIPILVEI
ncbi:MAG: MvaI/BcnI family restriction endonuclease [Pseudomonadota bacterium]